MCPVIAIACKTFFLVFLKSRWIKWHKHDTSFHQKVVLESPIRTAARSVGEEHKHFSRQKNKRKGGQVLLDPQSFIWRISYCTSLKIGIFAPKKAKNCTCNLKNLPLKMKKGGIFGGYLWPLWVSPFGIIRHSQKNLRKERLGSSKLVFSSRPLDYSLEVSTSPTTFSWEWRQGERKEVTLAIFNQVFLVETSLI